MNVAVIGSGAMGSLLGGHLSRAGHEVVLYDVFAEHVEAINRDGLSIETPEGEKITVHPCATTDPAATAASEVFVVFVKSNATRAVAEQFAALAPENAIAVTMQNGLGNAEILAEHFGADRAAAGVTSQGATFLGLGRIRHAGRGASHLCMRGGDNARLEPFCAALSAAGIEAHIEPDIDNLIWSKLVINVGINALTALTGLENGKLNAHRDLRELMKALVNEAMAVAAALGVEVSHADPVETVMQVAEKTGTNRSSMLQDFDRGRPSEIDVINGAIVREGARVGVPTPANLAVTQLVRALDEVHAGATS